MTDEELDEHIARLRRQGSDDALVEVKTSKDTLSTDVWQSVSAFANTAGGCLILGVSESEGFAPLAGFRSQRIIDQIDAGLDARPGATPKVLPVPGYRVFRMQVDASPVVVVEIDSLRGFALDEARGLRLTVNWSRLAFWRRLRRPPQTTMVTGWPAPGV